MALSSCYSRALLSLSLVGEVLLDGHNIKSMELKWLREQMGLVNQEPTVAENIRYGKLGGASMDEIIKAAKISCAHDFIDVLPKRYETQVRFLIDKNCINKNSIDELIVISVAIV